MQDDMADMTPPEGYIPTDKIVRIVIYAFGARSEQVCTNKAAAEGWLRWHGFFPADDGHTWRVSNNATRPGVIKGDVWARIYETTLWSVP